MGSYIQWKKPLAEATWDSVEIESSNFENGSFVVITTQSISNSTYFDPHGTASTWYRIRFFDSVNNLYSSYSSPLLGTLGTSNTYENLIDVITVMGTLGASGPDEDGNYCIWGMDISEHAAGFAVEQSYNYTVELVGQSYVDDPINAYNVKGFIMDYAALRILGILCGISIPTHFNYTIGGLNIQKPVVSQLRQAIELYLYSCKRWQTKLLRRHRVAKQTDLVIYKLNALDQDNISGNTFVSFDRLTI